MYINHQLQVQEKLCITDHGSWDSFNTSLHSEIQLSSKFRSRRELNAWSSEDDVDCIKSVHSLQTEHTIFQSIVLKETVLQAYPYYILLGATEQALGLGLENKTLPLWKISCFPSDATPQVQVTRA